MANLGNPRRVSLVFPILLIAIGGLFLYENSHPYFSPWAVLSRYWPLILIFVGLGKIWDNVRRSKDPNAPSDFPTGSTIGILIFVLILGAVVWKGRTFARHRDFSSSNSRISHTSQTIDLQGAQTVSATINMGAGSLTIGKSDTPHLLDASFEFFDDFRTPRVDYHVDGKRGDLEISENHGDFHVIAPNDNTRWNLRFGDSAPLSLDINQGAGEGDLHLGGLPVTNLKMNLGAGRAEVDLTGDRKKDLNAEINGGVGEAVIHLPKNVGVVATASGVIGAVDATGLKHADGEYTNESYGKSPATIHLRVAGAIGRIRLVVD
jgi:hypothetical protein